MKHAFVAFCAIFFALSCLSTSSAEPVLSASVSAVDPNHLRPGQIFSVTAVIFTEGRLVTSTSELITPSWLTVLNASSVPVMTSTNHPALVTYQVQVRADTPLSARGMVVLLVSDSLGHTVLPSFIASLCCVKVADARYEHQIRMPLMRR